MKNFCQKMKKKKTLLEQIDMDSDMFESISQLKVFFFESKIKKKV